MEKRDAVCWKPSCRPAVPNRFDTRDRFRGSQFFQWRSGRRGGHGFRMFQMHYTYHVLISNLMPCWSDRKYLSMVWRLGAPVIEHTISVIIYLNAPWAINTYRIKVIAENLGLQSWAYQHRLLKTVELRTSLSGNMGICQPSSLEVFIFTTVSSSKLLHTV